jgi:hypothetical protein
MMSLEKNLRCGDSDEYRDDEESLRTALLGSGRSWETAYSGVNRQKLKIVLRDATSR